MFFTLDVPASDLDVEDIRLLPSVGQILQHDEFILLIPELITTYKVAQPFFGILLLVRISDGDAGLALKLEKSVIFRDVLLEGGEGMRDVTGQDLLVELSLGTVVSL